MLAQRGCVSQLRTCRRATTVLARPLHGTGGTTTSLGRLLAWYQPMIARQCTVLAGSTNTLDLLKETSFSPKTDTDVGLLEAVKAVWPLSADASPKQQLLRHAAEYLCSQLQLSDKLGVDAPPYTAELGQVGQQLAQHPRRKAVSGSTRKLFKRSPFFSETVCGNRGSTVLLSLNTKALRQAARDHAKAHAPTSEVTAGQASNSLDLDALWPARKASPQDQLLRCAAEYLLAVPAFTKPGTSPKPHTDLLRKVALQLRRHPANAALPGKVSKLFDASAYFTVAVHDTTALVTLNVRAVRKAARQQQPPAKPPKLSGPGKVSSLPSNAKRALNAIWPVASATPKEQLLRCAAEYLWSAPPYAKLPEVPPQPHTAMLTTVGEVLLKHPCSAERPRRLSQLFMGSPYFQLTAHGKRARARLPRGSNTLVTLDVEAVVRNAGLSSKGPLVASAGARSPQAEDSRPTSRVQPKPTATAAAAAVPGTGLAAAASAASSAAGLLGGAVLLAAATTAKAAVRVAGLVAKTLKGPAAPDFTMELPDAATLKEHMTFSRLEVRTRQLSTVRQEEVDWLLRVTPDTPLDGDPKLRYSCLRRLTGDLGAVRKDNIYSSQMAPVQAILGFDTEFVGDRLALIQLCNADRVLLIQLPSSSARPLSSPPAMPQCLADVLTSRTIIKAAAEVWQDMLMVHHNLGVRMAGVICLTTEDSSRMHMQRRVGLLKMFDDRYPGTGLLKDKALTTSDWTAAQLSEEQLRYAALDAWMSWAVLLSMYLPGRAWLSDYLDVGCLGELELPLVCDIMSVQQQEQARSRDLVVHDFTSCAVEGDFLEVRMARFNTRIREEAPVVEVTGRNGSNAQARVEKVNGKRLTLGARGDEAGFQAVLSEGVKQIRFRNSRLTQERMAQRALLKKMLKGPRNYYYILAHGMLEALAGRVLVGPAPPRTDDARVADAEAAVRRLLTKERLNESQRQAVLSTLFPQAPMQIVHGPPGTGKTYVMAEVAAQWCAHPSIQPSTSSRPPLLLCCTRSNVAALNIAEAMAKKASLKDKFRLVVSREFYHEWHDEMYKGLMQSVIISDRLHKDRRKAKIEDDIEERMQVLVCTLGMLASPKLQGSLLKKRSVGHMLVDEASQVYAGDYLLHFSHLTSLRHMTFFGDDQQLPPFGSETTRVCSIFDSQRVWEECTWSDTSSSSSSTSSTDNRDLYRGPATVEAARPSVLLNVSYRLPAQLCAFVSQHVYDSQLQPARPLQEGESISRQELVWHDVQGAESRLNKSVRNAEEAEVVCDWAHALHRAGSKKWKVLSMYDAQRQAVEQRLKSRSNVPWEDRVFNVDTFQGREEDVIIVSLARTSGLGFLRDDRRVNVMLTRCKQRLILVGSLSLALQHPDTLLGKLASHCRNHDLVVQQVEATAG